MKQHKILCLVGFGLLAMMQAAQAAADVAGYWLTDEREGVVELYHCGKSRDQICGRFHWLRKDRPEHIVRDTENPDPSRHNQPLCGMQFMGGFKPADIGHFEDGWIYNPEDGAKYNAHLTLVDHNTLDLHGYLLLPVLGESRTWKRTSAKNGCNAVMASAER